MPDTRPFAVGTSPVKLMTPPGRTLVVTPAAVTRSSVLSSRAFFFDWHTPACVATNRPMTKRVRYSFARLACVERRAAESTSLEDDSARGHSRDCVMVLVWVSVGMAFMFDVKPILTPLATMLPTALTMFTPDAFDSDEPARLSEPAFVLLIVEPSTAMFWPTAEPMVVGPM